MFVQGPASPFFIYFVFAVVSGAMRWNFRSALLTTAAAPSASAAISMAAGSNPLTDDQFIIRCVQLTVVAVLVGYVTAYHARIQGEVLALAAWPRMMPAISTTSQRKCSNERAIFSRLRRSYSSGRSRKKATSTLCGVPAGQAESVRESPGTYSPIVKNRLERENFQGLDVTNPQGAIRLWSRGRFREKRGAPVDGSLRTRFGMSAIQSCMLDGDIVRGRLFWLSQDKMRIEDLVIGELVTRLATARMDTVYFLTRLEDSAGLTNECASRATCTTSSYRHWPAPVFSWRSPGAFSSTTLLRRLSGWEISNCSLNASRSICGRSSGNCYRLLSRRHDDRPTR